MVLWVIMEHYRTQFMQGYYELDNFEYQFYGGGWPMRKKAQNRYAPTYGVLQLHYL